MSPSHFATYSPLTSSTRRRWLWRSTHPLVELRVELRRRGSRGTPRPAGRRGCPTTRSRTGRCWCRRRRADSAWLPPVQRTAGRSDCRRWRSLARCSRVLHTVTDDRRVPQPVRPTGRRTSTMTTSRSREPAPPHGKRHGPPRRARRATTWSTRRWRWSSDGGADAADHAQAGRRARRHDHDHLLARRQPRRAGARRHRAAWRERQAERRGRRAPRPRDRVAVRGRATSGATRSRTATSPRSPARSARRRCWSCRSRSRWLAELEAAGVRGEAARDALRAILMCVAGFLVGAWRSDGAGPAAALRPRALWAEVVDDRLERGHARCHVAAARPRRAVRDHPAQRSSTAFVPDGMPTRSHQEPTDDQEHDHDATHR